MYLGVLLMLSLLIAHWLHPYPQNSNKVQELVLYTSCKIQTLSLTWHPEGPRAGLSPAIQAAIQTLNISGMTPAIWNLPPPGIGIWIWILPPTRNLNLNCFLKKVSYRDKLVSSRRIGSGARDSFDTLRNCCCCVYKLLKEKESTKQEGIWIVSVWTEETIKPK
jgi:hypothetical protein